MITFLIFDCDVDAVDWIKSFQSDVRISQNVVYIVGVQYLKRNIIILVTG